MADYTRISGSFRDPSGFVFKRQNVIYRQINKSYRENYDLLMHSGLYKTLTDAGLLIPHEEVDIAPPEPAEAYKIIKPDLIPFVSYPYGWCFSQLRDAALATLKIQKICIKFGMSLKDCSAYNIQFKDGRPVFIDTLSFEKYREGEPWIAYKQFCQHFLAPLALIRYKDIRLNQLLKIYMDGIPLDLASSLLPLRTHFNPCLFMHIHLHAKVQKCFSVKSIKVKKAKMGRLSLLGLIDNLECLTARMHWKANRTEWCDYYGETNYSMKAFEHKKQTVSDFLDELKPQVVWDFGANSGEFSHIAGKRNMRVIAFDIDAAAVEKNYIRCVSEGQKNVLPLVLDLTNPNPGIGWDNKERMSIVERGPADMALVLALIHHLAISNNLPFHQIADFLQEVCRTLVIEFIPKDDSQVQRLLRNREDIFTEYKRESFEAEFSKHFTILHSVPLRQSGRILYLMQRRSGS